MTERSEIEQFYIEKRLPKEVETLPYDILTDEEQRIIDKIREGKASELTDEEVSLNRQGWNMMILLKNMMQIR